MTWENWPLFMPPGALFLAGCTMAVISGFLLVMCYYAWQARKFEKKAANYAGQNGLQDMSGLLRLGISELAHQLAEKIRSSEVKRAEMMTYTDILSEAWNARDAVLGYWDLARWTLYILGVILLLILARTGYVFVTLMF